MIGSSYSTSQHRPAAELCHGQPTGGEVDSRLTPDSGTVHLAGSGWGQFNKGTHSGGLSEQGWEGLCLARGVPLEVESEVV